MGSDEEEQSKPKPDSSLSSETTDIPKITNVLSSKKSSWFTPKRLLVIFCIINLINYVDRGAIGSNGVNGDRGSCPKNGPCTKGSGIQGDFNLDNFQDGVLSSAFMVGLLVASPIFATLAKSVNPFRLIGVGLFVWTLAVAGCGISWNFWSIAICRMIVGVGEASFISLAAPFIDDNAPPAQRTSWLGIFYMCIPAGIAFGYVYGGQVGIHLGWRYAFFGLAIVMVPFVILGFIIKPLPLKGFSSAESEKALLGTETYTAEDKDGNNGVASTKGENMDQNLKSSSKSRRRCTNFTQLKRFLKDMKVLLCEKVFVINVLGYVAYNFVIGAYSYWGPKAGFSIYHMKNADMMFGGLTVICGIVGTILGGYILDKMTSTIRNAFKLLSVATFLGAAFCFSAFFMKNQYAFLALFAVGELCVFATQGPVNFVCLHCITPSLRPLSMAMSTVSIHIFGDVPSSPLVGVVQDHLNNWRKTALILTAILFLSAAIWFIGVFIKSVDRFDEGSETFDEAAKKLKSTEPVLEEKKSTEKAET